MLLEILAAINIVSTPILAYLGFRMVKKSIKSTLEQWINSDDGQKAIYTVGVLLGNAIKQGVGLQKSGGKLSLNNLIMQGIAGFLQSRIPIALNQEPAQ